MMIKAWMFTYLFWLGFSVLLITLEVLLGANFFLLWMGIVSAAMGILIWGLPEILWQYQLVLFAVASLVSMVGWHYYLKRHRSETDAPRLNRRAEQYIGRTFILSEAIVNGRGKIRVDDSTWQVEGPELPEGSKVEVTSVNGVMLIVQSR